MSQTQGATGEFATSARARAAVARLVRAGFDRSDIDAWPRGGVYLVHVKAGEDDHGDAVRALREREAGFSDVIGSTGSSEVVRLLPLGLAALAGLVLYSLAKRR